MSCLEEAAIAAIKTGRHLAEAWHSAGIWPSALDKRKIGTLLTALENRDPVDADMLEALEAMRLYAVRTIEKIRPGFGTLLERGEYLPQSFGYLSEMEPALAVYNALSRFKTAQNAYLDRVAVEQTLKGLGFRP